MMTWRQLLGLIDLERQYIAAMVEQEETTPPTTSADDVLISAKVAAVQLGVSESTLYQYADRYPFTRRGPGGVRFSQQGIRAWIAGPGFATPTAAEPTSPPPRRVRRAPSSAA